MICSLAATVTASYEVVMEMIRSMAEPVMTHSTVATATMPSMAIRATTSSMAEVAATL